MTTAQSPKQLSLPNAVVWDYFHTVELAVSRCLEAVSERIARLEAATAVVMAVTAVEVFLNLYFRVVVEEEKFSAHKEYLIKCISGRKPLDFKLKEWPRKILGAAVADEAAYKEFWALKDLRNSIVHFSSTHESFRVPGTNLKLEGLADNSKYMNLKHTDAQAALDTARSMVQLIFLCRGVGQNQIGDLMHDWCGMPH